MRKVFFAVLLSTTVLAVAPVTALAHGHHHRRHHHAQRNHSRVTHERFGSRSDASQAPANAPLAGEVASFGNGVLTIRLSDGSMVSGRVDQSTQMKCEQAGPEDMQQAEHSQGDHGGGGDNGMGDHGGGGDNGPGDHGNGAPGANDGHGADEQGEQLCPTADLVPGAGVTDAELTISRGGAVWNEVDLAA